MLTFFFYKILFNRSFLDHKETSLKDNRSKADSLLSNII